MQLLKASKRGKLPIVNSAGELVALATRALFKEHSNLPLGGAPPPPPGPPAVLSPQLGGALRLPWLAGRGPLFQRPGIAHVVSPQWACCLGLLRRPLCCRLAAATSAA